MSKIRGSTVLVTGAAGGIGGQLATWLALEEARLVLWDVDAPRLDDAVDYLRSGLGAEVQGYPCDVSDRSAVHATAERVAREVGPVDILVNNAGLGGGLGLLELPEERIAQTFGVNTLALFWTCKAFLPSMVERNRGHIVTVASAAGLLGVPRLADYCSSKWAAVGFNDALRRELRRLAPAVRTTLVCTSFVRGSTYRAARSPLPHLLPVLRECDVAERIVRAILHDEARVAQPPLLGVVPALHALPTRAFDALAERLGVGQLMDRVTMRPGTAPA